MASSPEKSGQNQPGRLDVIRGRIRFVEWVLFGLVMILAAKAIQIQILESVDLSLRAENEYTGTIILNGKRGEILDRNMKCLGTTTDALSAAASPVSVQDPVRAAGLIAPILKLDRADLEKKLKSGKTFTWIKKRVSPQQAEEIQASGIEGIFFKKDVARFYPNRCLAGQVIGFTGSDGKGLEGIEFFYDETLGGQKAEVRITKDGHGRRVDTEKRLEKRFKGDSLVLTLDMGIQHLAETALKEAVMEHEALSGIAAAMDPRTGEILAIAHWPDFNPNSFSDYTRDRWRNRAVTDPFEPGSVMKVFLAGTALEKGLCTPTSIFYCENGKYRIGRFTIHDTHDHGWLTLKEIVQVSSNIGAVKVSEILGKQILHDSLAAYGFGGRTGIECPGESPGTLLPYSRWSDIDAGAIAFGQGIAVSVIQLVSALSCVANDGLMMKPYLVREVIANTGEIRRSFTPEPVRRVMSIQSAMEVKQMMASVVEDDEGTGTKAAIDGYSVCGKTGTAQKVASDGSGYSHRRYTAVFMGFAPASDPRISVLVVIDEPRRNHYGGIVAAPAFRKIVVGALHYMNVEPDLNVTPEVSGNRLLAGFSGGGRP